MRVPAFVLLSAVFSSAQTATPDPVDLMRRSAKAEKENNSKRRQYAYREYKVNRDFDKNGKETGRETETWEVIGLEGSTYRKLIMRNDKPLPHKEQRREDERLVKETERRKKETPEERRRRTLSISYSFNFPYERAAELYELRDVGGEDVRGRRTHIVEGTPRSGFRPSTDDEKEALN